MGGACLTYQYVLIRQCVVRTHGHMHDVEQGALEEGGRNNGQGAQFVHGGMTDWFRLRIVVNDDCTAPSSAK